MLLRCASKSRDGDSRETVPPKLPASAGSVGILEPNNVNHSALNLRVENVNNRDELPSRYINT